MSRKILKERKYVLLTPLYFLFVKEKGSDLLRVDNTDDEAASHLMHLLSRVVPTLTDSPKAWKNFLVDLEKNKPCSVESLRFRAMRGVLLQLTCQSRLERFWHDRSKDREIQQFAQYLGARKKRRRQKLGRTGRTRSAMYRMIDAFLVGLFMDSRTVVLLE